MKNILIFISWVLSVQAIPTIYIVNPSPSTSYLIIPGESSHQVPFQYQLFDSSLGEQWQICIELKNVKTSQAFLSMTCLPSNAINQEYSLTLQQPLSGQYSLRAILKDNTGNLHQESEVMSYFSMLEYIEAVPILQINSGPRALAADSITNVATLTVDYSLTQRAFDTEGFTVCVKLINQDSRYEILDWSCLNPLDRSFILRNLPLGIYILSFVLRDTRNTISPTLTANINELLRQQTIQQVVSVQSLRELLPTIMVSTSPIEIALQPNKNTTNVNIAFHLEGIPSSIQQLQVCISLHQLAIQDTESSEMKQLASPQILLQKSCLPSSSNTFTIPKLPSGIIETQFRLASLSGEHFGEISPKVIIEIQPMQEFKPTYIWQALKPWHSIPLGLETRLPLDGIHHKEARIPQPWRLQLFLPKPCKNFLRLDLNAISTLYHIM
jgi:hypothetical protein